MINNLRKRKNEVNKTNKDRLNNLFKKINYKTNGITLIALVITIIILLLLAGVTISAIVNGGLITRANEAQFKTRMAEFRDTTNQYVAWVVSDTLDTDTSKINSGEVLKDAIDREIVTVDLGQVFRHIFLRIFIIFSSFA